MIEKNIRKAIWKSKILNKSKDRDCDFLVIFSSSKTPKSYCERKDDSLMLAAICVDTWNVLNMQHLTPNLKIWDYSDIPSGGYKKI